MTVNIAQLISEKLATGLYHPGEKDQPPVLIRLPLYKTAAMPPEMYRQIEETTKLIGEAIVHLIEHDGGCEIIDRAELEALRSDE